MFLVRMLIALSTITVFNILTPLLAITTTISISYTIIKCKHIFAFLIFTLLLLYFPRMVSQMYFFNPPLLTRLLICSWYNSILLLPSSEVSLLSPVCLYLTSPTVIVSSIGMAVNFVCVILS